MTGRDRIGSPSFTAVNALIPVVELQNLRQYFNKLKYQEAAEYIVASGLELAHFYFKRDDPFACFCYYRDLVWIDIPVFTREGLESFQIMQLIEFEEQRVKDCISRGDFRTLFYIADKRIALLVFEELFDSIPDEDKYDHFWFIYSRCGLGLDDFPPGYIEEIQRFRTGPLEMPGDHSGLEIYRGQSEPRSTTIHREYSWTVDLNTAIRFAVEQGGETRVYKALIDKQDAAAYIKRKNEKEIVVYPGRLRDIEPVKLLSIADLKPEMERRGVIERYHYYAQRLKKEYFYRPEGTHGIMHTRRVLMLNLVLSTRLNISPRRLNILCTAALYHDIGRINDNVDPGHGVESFRRAREMGLINLLGSSDQEILRYIIENHCISDQKAREHLPQYALPDLQESQELFDIFKDADGLDRVRINDLDQRQLRTDEGKNLLLVARQLFHDFNSIF